MTLGDLGHLLPRHMWAYGVGHPDGSSLGEDESRRSRESEAVDAAVAVGLGAAEEYGDGPAGPGSSSSTRARAVEVSGGVRAASIRRPP